MPPASRITDLHTCPVHPGGPVASGSPDTLIAFAPAARVTDRIACGGAVDVVQRGSSTVFINHLEAARIGDPTAHGGLLATGAPNVIIGETAQTQALVAAATAANFFVEECPYAKQDGEPGEASDSTEGEGVVPSTEELPPPPSNPYATTEEQRELAASDGDSAPQRAAREQVVREFYEQHRDDGLGVARADQDLGVGGAPPRANAHAAGFAIDLSRPVKLVALPPSGRVAMLVRRHGQAAGSLVNVIEPVTPLEPGASASGGDGPAVRPERVVLAVPPSGGVALEAFTGAVRDTWVDPNEPSSPGGDRRWTIPNTLRESLSCVACGSPPDLGSTRFVRLSSGKTVPRRCSC